MLGTSAWWNLALFSSQCIFLAGCPLHRGIIYLGKAGEVDVSEPGDSVSEHEKLVSLSTIESSGAGVAVLFGEEGSEKGLSSQWKSRSIFMCRSLNIPAEFLFQLLTKAYHV